MACTSQCRKPRGRQAHCGVCHLTFSGVRPFDDHRFRGQCRMGTLTQKNGVWGHWGTRTNRHWE